MRPVNRDCGRGRRQPALHRRRDRLQPQRRHGSLPAADRRRAEAGADAVKFQSWTETSLIAERGIRAEPQLRGQEDSTPGRSARWCAPTSSRPSSTSLPATIAGSAGSPSFSSAFAPAEVDLLDRAGRPVHQDRLDGRQPTCRSWPCRPGPASPSLISTGMATLGEIERGHGHRACRGQRGRSSCSTASRIYPAAPSTVHLRNLETLRQRVRRSRSGSATTRWGRRSRSPPSPWAHA